MAKTREIICDYQQYIDAPPQGVSQKSLYGQACANDEQTVHNWRPIWLKNYTTNSKRFGPFKDKGLGQLHGAHRNLPAVVIGSGPSLKENAHELKDLPAGIPVLSCLHNFHFLEDLGVRVDYYVSLDAGEVTISEVSEGGTRTPEQYWELTKDRTLLCYAGTDPGLLEKWQGKVYFFNCRIPDESLSKELNAVEVFNTVVSSGGNVLGAATYIAKGIFGCNPLVFMGADFSFSYKHKFHGWDSKYDKNIGNCVSMTDVFGNRVLSWQSYSNFKSWFDWLSMAVPGVYINCTEGGTFGAYPGGNIRSVMQMTIRQFITMQTVCDELTDVCANPETDKIKILF